MRQIYIPTVLLIILLTNCSKENDTINSYEGIIIGDYSRTDFNYNHIVKGSIKVNNELDINNDGQKDIRLSTYYYHSPNGYSAGSSLKLNDSLFEYALINKNGIEFKAGDTINSSLSWKNEDITFQDHYEFYPDATSKHIVNWVVSDSGYIAVRYFIGSKKKYGWIKVVGSETRVTEYVIEK